jgi:hypothetical protein
MIRTREELSDGARVWICRRIAQAAYAHGDCRRQAEMTWFQGGVEGEALVGSVRPERNQGILVRRAPTASGPGARRGSRQRCGCALG